MSATSARKLISRIDRQIDAIRAQLCSQVPGLSRSLDPAVWQAAWDRFPERRRREKALFRRRGICQLHRDLADAQAARRVARNKPLRKSKCAACGSTIYAKAA